MPTTLYPAGTATGNADAVRSAPIAQAFYLFADILKGADSDARMEPGMTTDDGLLGPSASFGVDIGIDANGDPYMRGRSTGTQDSRATPAHDAGVASDGTIRLPKLSPVAWALIAFVAYKLIK